MTRYVTPLLNHAFLHCRSFSRQSRLANVGCALQYLIVTLGDARQSTPTILKTLNPEWNVSFEMPVVGVPLLECICWDHDRFGKDYLGEFDIPLEEIFMDGELQQQVSCVNGRLPW